LTDLGNQLEALGKTVAGKGNENSLVKFGFLLFSFIILTTPTGVQ
jgi:hypothetical protein